MIIIIIIIIINESSNLYKKARTAEVFRPDFLSGIRVHNLIGPLLRGKACL